MKMFSKSRKELHEAAAQGTPTGLLIQLSYWAGARDALLMLQSTVEHGLVIHEGHHPQATRGSKKSRKR
jgi:hypothetical protein